MMKKLVSLTVLLIVLLGLPVVSAQESVQIGSIAYVGYVGSIIEITFPHTTAISSNVSSLSGGLFTYTVETGNPDSTIRYLLNDSDIYTVKFSATYPVQVNGNVSWTFFSPGFTPENSQATFYNSTSIALSFTIELLTQPIFPSADEIANATSGLVISLLNQHAAAQQEATQAEISSLQEQVWLLAGIVVFVTVVTTAVILVMFRRYSNAV